MKTRTTFLVLRLSLSSAVLCSGLSASLLTAQNAQPPKPAQAPKTTTAPPVAKPIKFQLPNVGAASVRLTGGSRGKGDEVVVLDVLTPDTVGLTTQEQPSLFWYQSKPSKAKFELTLLQDKQVKPLVHVKLDEANRSGIQRLKLSEHGAKLVPGVEYQWVVALVTDPENRSTDLVASGAIKRIEPGAELQEKIRQSSRAELPQVYADAGIWYDALASLSDQIEANPADENLRETRRDLLRQVGLKAAANF